MTEEMTRAGMEAEARRRMWKKQEQDEAAKEFARCALWTLGILGGLALLLLVAHVKREARDAHAALEHAHYELMAVTGGAK